MMAHRTYSARLVLGACIALVLAVACGCHRDHSRRFRRASDDSLPRLSAVNPAIGPLAGGNTVELTGKNFAAPDQTQIFFGAKQAQILAQPEPSATAMKVVVPAGDAPGAVDVTVQTGADKHTLSRAYLYAVPEITAVSPARGPLAGGTAIQIFGARFTDTAGTTITLGGTPVTQFEVRDDRVIDAVTPPAAHAGFADLQIANYYGTGTLVAAFNYVGPPAVASVTPARGPVSGGTAVVIEGTGFADAPGVEVFFGDGRATSVSVEAEGTRINATTPAAARPGRVDVKVENSFGEGVLAGGFTYFDPAAGEVTIESVTPPHGPLAGGTLITITGTAFTYTGDLRVLLGDRELVGTEVIDSQTVRGTTPPGAAPGPVNVQVLCANGDANLPDGFTYLASMRIDAVVPDNGPVAGGTTVTISGAGFTTLQDTTVRFGAATASITELPDSGTIVCVTPAAAAAGSVDVTVTSSNGQAVLADGFLYYAPLALASVTPASGPLAGGTSVELKGAGFTAADDMTVRFGENVTASVNVVDSETLYCVTPAGAAPGAVAVTITRFEGTETATLADGFTYLPPASPPRIDSIAPASGPVTGGTQVTISGDFFTAAGTEVRIGANLLQNAVVQSATTITGRTPAGQAIGPVDVTVATPHGQAVLEDGFLYTAAPDAPVVEILFPLGGITTAPAITIEGTADDKDGVAGVTVNGSAAQLAADKRHFQATVALALGENTFVVGAVDALGQANDSAAVVSLLRTVREPPDGPLGVAFDSRGEPLYSDHVQRGIFAAAAASPSIRPFPAWDIDGAGGMIDAVYIPNFMSVSENGADLVGPVTLKNAVFLAFVRTSLEAAFCTSLSNRAVWRMNPVSGEAFVVTNGEFGSGAALTSPRGIAALQDGALLVADWAEGTIVHIDEDGARTVVSGAGIGAGPALAHPGAIALIDQRTLAVACAMPETVILSVELPSGNRTVLADAQHGAGPVAGAVFDLEADPQGGSLVLSDPAAPAIIGLDPGTGDRFMLLAGAWGNGPKPRRPQGIAAAGSALYVVERAKGDVYRVDIQTADRTLASKGADGAPALDARAIAVRGDAVAYIAGRSSQNIVAVTLATGARRVLSGGSIGTGPALRAPAALFCDANDTLLIADRDAVIRVYEKENGRRETVAQGALGDLTAVARAGGEVVVAAPGGIIARATTSGQLVQIAVLPAPEGSATCIVPSGGGALVLTPRAVFALDVAAGTLQMVSGGAKGIGPALAGGAGIARDGAGRLFAIDAVRAAVFQMQEATGDRTLRSR
ncbi:MAG TPA: hypothetical protein DCM87_06375 [Planctomycetes bacterium]|nr:hypothetical protein [Planctomycetota bacterium]